ncbi:MAG: teicoplanin resistance protein VanZ, partial [Clostridiales bacterium]|nr:teicoplanin resistance protein VanZ [Clostridiales bacterium]
MGAYMTPIVSGVLVFLGLLYFFSLPIAIIQYRKYNGFLVKKTFIWASFILYMIIAWFMTVLPLPSREAVANMKPVQPNFRPFLFIETFLK